MTSCRQLQLLSEELSGLSPPRLTTDSLFWVGRAGPTYLCVFVFSSVLSSGLLCSISVALTLVAPVLFLPHKGSCSFLLFTLPPDAISLTSIKYWTLMLPNTISLLNRVGLIFSWELQYKLQEANHIFKSFEFIQITLFNSPSLTLLFQFPSL